MFLFFCLFSPVVAVDGQQGRSASFVDVEAQPDSRVPLLPTPTAPTWQAVQEGAGSTWTNYRKGYSAFSAQTVQPQPAQEAQAPVRCIIVDDPEAPTVFGASGGPIIGSTGHVELTTKQVKMEIKNWSN